MTYKLIGDSCCDPDEQLKKDPHYCNVPLILELGDYQVVDDYNFNQVDFINRMAASPIGPKSACPSPQAFKKAMEGEEEMVFVVTLSKHLSGSYQSAMVGQSLYEEEHGEKGKQILVINSNSASAGQYRILLELKRLCDAGLDFAEIKERILKFRDRMLTFFVIESLEALRKNGRLSAVTAFIASALNIKPVMGAKEGVILKKSQARGMGAALQKMADIALKEAGEEARDMEVCITHINNPERGEMVAGMFREKNIFKEIHITQGAGVATLYAGNGGIVIGIG